MHLQVISIGENPSIFLPSRISVLVQQDLSPGVAPLRIGRKVGVVGYSSYRTQVRAWKLVW